jgi:hypothetical protein
MEDVEEFELARRVPREAITGQILEGVRNLHEINEIEAFLREIVPDQTETPHNPTEIADILTTHITYAGQPHLTAFVNKGRSYSKVSAREVTHQIYRLKHIPDIGIMILLAVGDIQDDAKRDFISIAQEQNARYMIVDVVDVARLFIAYHKICPQDGTPFVEGNCRKCGTSASKPIELVLKVYEEPEYTPLSFDDVSTPLAKRYRLGILTDRHYSKAVLREVIKKAIWEARQSRYYKSEANKLHFGDRDADCVFLFVFVDMRDLQSYNWVCQASWVRSDLAAKPVTGGNEWLGDIQIEWKQDYLQMRKFWSERTVKQEVWIETVQGLLRRVEAIDREASSQREAFTHHRIDKLQFQSWLEQAEDKVLQILRDAGTRGVPPVHCQEGDSAFLNMISTFHNIFVPFAKWGKASWTWEQKLRMMQDYLRKYQADKDTFVYEWRKFIKV